MITIKTFLSSVVFWGAWIIIPIIMEIVPSIGGFLLILKRRNKINKSYEKPVLYPEISLIVPVYNSSQTLFNCIRSIRDSEYPNDRIRIFLVNNQGKDNSFDVFAQCQKAFPELRMQWLNAKQGKSRALNLALYNSDGKYIINLDSDGILEKSALTNMVDKFEACQDLNCMTGAILIEPRLIEEYKGFFPRLLRKLEFMEYAQAFLAGRSYASEINAVYTLSGAFSAFRKSAILKSRMYNTSTICEDTHITFQMRYIQKERVEICENALFFVDPIEGINKLYTQRQRWQRGSLEVAKQFLDKNNHFTTGITDVNIKTLLYDHTFAFPRLIWYLALICLLCMNYSSKVILGSVSLIFIIYIIVGYLYFATVLVFLRGFKEVRNYYAKNWWVVALLPFFNFIVFFIRMAGIINSIGTDSAWKTRNLTDEKNAFVDVVKSEFSVVLTGLKKVRDWVNNEMVESENEK
ncbi:MAG: TIGR03111 family XrtG-associated glycosyltransferase [Lachnospiraceae bacterium]